MIYGYSSPYQQSVQLDRFTGSAPIPRAPRPRVSSSDYAERIQKAEALGFDPDSLPVKALQARMNTSANREAMQSAVKGAVVQGAMKAL